MSSLQSEIKNGGGQQLANAKCPGHRPRAKCVSLASHCSAGHTGEEVVSGNHDNVGWQMSAGGKNAEAKSDYPQTGQKPYGFGRKANHRPSAPSLTTTHRSSRAKTWTL